MSRLRARWAVLVVGILAAGAVGAVACTRTDPPPTGIALVDTDTGPTGARIAQSLTKDGGGYDWTVVEPGAASTADFAAVITLPADLTTAMGSLAGPQPQRAKLTVATHEDADPHLVDGATAVLTKRIGATGVDAALTAVAQARTQLTGVQLTAQLLGAGVQVAAAGADQFNAGAEQMLGFLDFAKSGAAQLTSAIELLNSTVAGATAQAEQLAAALDSTGVTIAQVEQSAQAVGSGLDQILPLLRGLPFAGDPALADIISKLEGLRALAGQAGSQLTGIGTLVGGSVDPDTDLGTLLRTVVDRLTAASAQLTQGAELAAGLPQLAEQGGAQLIDAMGQLTGGVEQLQTIVTNLGTQTGKAMDALPVRSSAQQSAIASALTDPVEIVRE